MTDHTNKEALSLDEIKEVEPASPNFRTELAQQLASLIPEAVADGKINVEKIKELLDDDADDGNERFGLFWPGKKRAIRAAQEPTTATLKPDFENSKDWETTKNVFIEGDNLEVLKILQKHYHGKIKMIYIDPPYNTGKDFIYPDNYREGLTSYLEWTRQVNEEGKKTSSNSETDGRYHSNWLNMMYPRLKLARNLLTGDGVICVSIDDAELAQLRKLMDEIFGEMNYYATVVWQKKYAPANDAKRFSDVHDYIVIYSRSDLFSRNLFPRTEENNKPYKHDDGDGRGRYRTDNLSVRTYSAVNDYPVTNPLTGEEYLPPAGRSWSFPVKEMAKLIAENRVYWGKDGRGAPQLKRYLSEVQQGTVPTTLWTHEFAGHTDSARKEIKYLFGTSAVFDTPKSSKLMQRLLQVCTDPHGGDIVLDFFAGSGTLGHSVFNQNKEDGGNRRFILVQLPEPLSRPVEKYSTVADVGRERVRLVGVKLVEEQNQQLQEPNFQLDVGARVFLLSDSNFLKWSLDSESSSDELEQQLLKFRDNAADNATQDDLLTEILLKQGFSLTEKIEPVELAGLELRSIGDGVALAYLDEHQKPTLDQLRAVIDEQPAKLFILEDAFQGDDELKTNLAQMCRHNGVELWTA